MNKASKQKGGDTGKQRNMEKGTALKLTKLFGKFLFDNFGRCLKLFKKVKFKDAKELEKQVIMYLLPVTVILTSKSQ